MNKVWYKQDVVGLIKDPSTPVHTIGRLLVCLYDRQTSDEQNSERTTHQNGRGFNSTDADFLSNVAKSCQRFNFNLTPRMDSCVRKSIIKYAGQLVEALNSGEVSNIDPSPAPVMRQNSRQTPVPIRQNSPQPRKSAYNPSPEPSVPSDDEWQSLLQESEKFASEL